MRNHQAHPQPPLSAGIPSRYSCWRGASGRRYVFTRLDFGGLEDFSDGVVIAVRNSSVIWAGEVAVLPHMPLTAWMQGATFHVHLIAETGRERRMVIDDLRPPERQALQLAA